MVLNKNDNITYIKLSQPIDISTLLCDKIIFRSNLRFKSFKRKLLPQRFHHGRISKHMDYRFQSRTTSEKFFMTKKNTKKI